MEIQPENFKGASFDSTSFVSKSPSTEVFKQESRLYYKEESKVKSIQVHSNIEILEEINTF